jgi:ATP-dependent RNA circularization protein (DNA/RNA ligase family)
MDLESKLKNYPGLVIYGELYGNVKGWAYDCPKVNNRLQRKFRVFDIWDTNNKKFLEWDDVEKISKDIGLETAPVLYIGQYRSDRSLNELAEGKSTIGECIREGWVIRSVPEKWHEKLGRKILKLKGRGYKLAKG